MTVRAWIERKHDLELDGSLRHMANELRRLYRRAHRRPVIVVLIASLATSGAVMRQAVEKETFEASVAFSVVERLEALPEGTRPLTKRRLRDYVREGIFTRQRLRVVVEQHRLYPGWQKVSLGQAIEAMRDDIKVDVFQNYFLKEDLDDHLPRSARLRISYTYTNPRVALAVAQQLGSLVQQHEAAMRKLIADHSARQTLLAQQRTETRLDTLREHLAEVNVELAQAKLARKARLQVELGQLQSAIVRVEQQLQRLLRDHELSELHAGLERNDLLLRFQQTETRHPDQPALSRSSRLVLVGVVIFLIFLPICGIAVGAFDPLVYYVEDLRCLGLPALGHLAHYPGDRARSFDQRGDVGTGRGAS